MKRKEYGIKDLFNFKKVHTYFYNYFSKRIKVMRTSYRNSKIKFFLQTMNLIFILVISYYLIPNLINSAIYYLGGFKIMAPSPIIIVLFGIFATNVLEPLKRIKINFTNLYKTDFHLTILISCFALIFILAYYYLPSKIKLVFADKSKNE